MFTRAVKILGCKQLTLIKAENNCLDYWLAHRIYKKGLSIEVT